MAVDMIAARQLATDGGLDTNSTIPQFTVQKGNVGTNYYYRLSTSATKWNTDITAKITTDGEFIVSHPEGICTSVFSKGTYTHTCKCNIRPADSPPVMECDFMFGVRNTFSFSHTFNWKSAPKK